MRIVAIVVAVIVVGCGQGVFKFDSDINDKNNSKLPITFEEPKNLGEWNEQTLYGIKLLQDYIGALKEVIAEYYVIKDQFSDKSVTNSQQQTFPTLQNFLTKRTLAVIKPAASMSMLLTNGNDAVDNWVKMTEAKGQFIANWGQMLGQMAGVNKTLAESKKLEVEAVGQAVSNVGKHLQNVKAMVEIQLLSKYLQAYSAYTRTYSRYMQTMLGIYAKIDINAKLAISAATKEMKDYEKQSAICMVRAKNTWRAQSREANGEFYESQISYRNLTEAFNRYAELPNGEECLHRVLLTSHSANDGWLYNLNMTIESKSNMKLFCGSSELEDKIRETEIWASDIDLMNYPPYAEKEQIIDGKTIQNIAGLYRPVTYYQLYRLVTNPTYNIKINPPDNISTDYCQIIDSESKQEITSSQYPEQKSYVKAVRDFERDLLSAIQEEDQRVFGSYHDFTPIDRDVKDTTIANRNEAYKSLFRRLNGIFSQVNACMEMQWQLKNNIIDEMSTTSQANNPAINSTATNPEKPAEQGTAPKSENTPIAAPKLGMDMRSVLAADVDITFPKMVTSIKGCSLLAENYRQNALKKIEVVKAISEVLEKMANTPPPKGPAPVFMPVEAKVANLPGGGF